MKRIAVVVGLGLMGMLCRAQSTPKQETEIKNVVGTVNNMYALVRTTIYKESPKPTVEGMPAVENKPIVSREVMGNPVGPLNKDSGPIDIALKIPTLDAKIKTY